MAEVVDLSRLLDQRGLSSFHYNLIFWCVLLSLIDGYDIAAIAFAAPHLVREWALKPDALKPVLVASLIGILFGSFFFQAEDGIRDGHVIGVPTCALPISCGWTTRLSGPWKSIRPPSRVRAQKA